MIDLIEDPTVRFLTACCGTGSGKTLRDFGIHLHEMWHNPFSGLFTPCPPPSAAPGATSICHQLIQTLDASADPARIIRSGVRPTIGFGRLNTAGAARKISLTKTHI